MNDPKPLTVVGVGASAGGVEAFKGFFENMPADSGLAFVVILHLPVDGRSLLPEILSRWTGMRVVEANEGCVVEANCVYVPPAGAVVTFAEGRLHPHTHGLAEPREMVPIDIFFSSLANALKEEAIGIVLSGTGSDGALGLKAIKSQGGLTLAQGADGTSPQHSGMPSSAIATGAVDIVASVEAMPRHILDVLSGRNTIEASGALSAEQINDARLAICTELHRQLDHDFSGYKEKTFLRRVQRRIQVLGLSGLQEYIERLKDDKTEVVLLFHDLLIGVTSFFRDAETFERLRRLVVPRLFAGKGPSDTVRVWVAGCATGEEAYSLAMLLCEHQDTLDDSAPRLQVFATDIDEPAIAIARLGRYPGTLLEGLAPERRSRFFSEGADGTFMVSKAIREVCTFSAHSLVRDPPFSRIDLVSCRNLLIYLDSDLQGVVIPAFHYSLVPGGVLLLGSSETISRHEALFAPIDKQARIFERRDEQSPQLHLTGRGDIRDAQPPRKSGTLQRIDAARTGIARMNNKAITRVLERFAPAFVVVDAQGDVQHFSNRIGRFLEPAPGLPSQNVLAMARSGLRSTLRTALREAVESGRAVERKSVGVAVAGEGIQQITLIVDPLHEPNAAPSYLIVFVDRPEATAIPTSKDLDREGGEHDADRPLESELRDTREQLQSVTEEHETALEELRSANEELHSVNEELQSTNEELETSKEEIQSINEELQTVNGQLASKVDELDRRNSDLKNLFDSTQVATDLPRTAI